MIKAIARMTVPTLLLGLFLIPDRLPAPTDGDNGSTAPGPRNEVECVKRMADIDKEYVLKHLALVKEMTAKRQSLLKHCMSLRQR